MLNLQTFKTNNMFKFLMVSTVFSKKQFTYVIINKEEDFLLELMKLAFNHTKIVLFPIMNKQDISNIENLVDNKWKDALFNQVNDNNQILGLEIRNQCVRVYSLEHIENDVFNIMSDKGIFTANTFKPCIIYE